MPLEMQWVEAQGGFTEPKGNVVHGQTENTSTAQGDGTQAGLVRTRQALLKLTFQVLSMGGCRDPVS